jgi:hypothetical protein
MTNTGKSNTGYNNTGDRNTGGRNTGNWNSCNYETGYFNTEQSDVVRVFNKDMSREEWGDCYKPDFIFFDLTEWISEESMTDQEKEDNQTYKTAGGYLKSYEYKEAFQKAWDEADEEDRKKIFNLPNFDAEVFKKISGIDVYENKTTCAGKIVEINGKKYKLEEV